MVHLEILVALAKVAVSLALTRVAEAGVRTGPHGQVRVGALAGKGIGTLIHRDQLFSHSVGLLPRVEDLELQVGAEVAENAVSWAIDSLNARRFSVFTARDTGIARMSARRGKTEDLLLLHLLLHLRDLELGVTNGVRLRAMLGG